MGPLFRWRKTGVRSWDCAKQQTHLVTEGGNSPAPQVSRGAPLAREAQQDPVFLMTHTRFGLWSWLRPSWEQLVVFWPLFISVTTEGRNYPSGWKRKWEQFKRHAIWGKQEPGHRPICLSPNLFPNPRCWPIRGGWIPRLETKGWFKVTVGLPSLQPPWSDPVTARPQLPTHGTEKWFPTPEHKGLFILAVSLEYTQNSKQLQKHLGLLNFSLRVSLPNKMKWSLVLWGLI